jgi:hypothetical protein
LTAIDGASNESYRPAATGTTSTSPCSGTGLAAGLLGGLPS